MTTERLEALDSALPPRAPDNSLGTSGRVGFLNLSSKDAVSLIVCTGGAEKNGGDGLGRCVF